MNAQLLAPFQFFNVFSSGSERDDSRLKHIVV